MNYEVGQAIGYVRYSRYGLQAWGFGTIEKINGHGHIFVKAPAGTRRFDKFGDSYQDLYGPKLIGAARLTGLVEHEERVRNTDKAVRELLEVVSNRRCGSGDYTMNTETLDDIDAMVKKLREMVG
jgi:hypothetical protein